MGVRVTGLLERVGAGEDRLGGGGVLVLEEEEEEDEDEDAIFGGGEVGVEGGGWRLEVEGGRWRWKVEGGGWRWKVQMMRKVMLRIKRQSGMYIGYSIGVL